MSAITREPVTHNLKIWPEYFAAVRDGLKRAELRWNDREYQSGDTLDLCEWDPNEEAFTGDLISVIVTHVAELGQWMPGYVLLSFAPPAPVYDEDLLNMAASAIDDQLSNKDRSGAGAWVDIPAKLRRAAMLQGADDNSPVIPDCSCRTCRPVTFSDSRFVVCPECGNKRCPHANDHRNACTGSNEPGQEGSAYPAAPQQEMK